LLTQATGFGYGSGLPSFSFANSNATNAYFMVKRNSANLFFLHGRRERYVQANTTHKNFDV
jgi:hypothetical protein